jgi:hypothetical protein
LILGSQARGEREALTTWGPMTRPQQSTQSTGTGFTKFSKTLKEKKIDFANFA